VADHIKLTYEYLTKARNNLLAYHQERHFGESAEAVAALLTGCDGYVTPEGIAVLEIGETLPHGKAELTPALHGHWLGCIHAAIGKLAEKTAVPQFDKAMVGIRIDAPRGANNARVWDTSNRAINLILNNLKGIFFPDDDVEHMAFAVAGRWSNEPKTMLYIGDFRPEKGAEIMRHLAC